METAVLENMVRKGPSKDVTFELPSVKCEARSFIKLIV